MKRFGILVLSLCLLLGVASFLQAQDAAPAPASENDFVLVNSTGYVLDQVYVSPSKANEWEEDVLGQDVLKDGEQVTIKFHPKATTGNYDLKVVYEVDKSSSIWTDLDLTKINKLTIKYDKEKDVSTFVAE